MPAMKRVLGFAWLALAHPALAQWLIAAPTTEVAAGKWLEVIVVPPPGEPAPDRLRATLSLGERKLPTLLERTETAGTGQARYRLTMPADFAGLVTIDLSDSISTKLLVQSVVPSALAVAIEEKVGKPAPPPSAEGPPSPALQANEPMYFIVGSSGDDVTARFQLSMKYRLFDPAGLLAGFLPGIEHFYFAYTQNSIWDLSGDSKPFRDTSYRPSFFYDWTPNLAETGPRLSIRAGYEHESNGREGSDSRSIDTLFVRPTWHFALDRGNFFEIAPKFWYYLDREDNPDIARYRGYTDLTVRGGDHQGLIGQLHLRRGTAGKGSAQLDLSYRLKRSLFSNVGGFIHAQYFAGYGESILDYNHRRRPEFRLGFSIVR